MLQDIETRPATRTSWKYSESVGPGGRDLRLDFLRGMVMFSLLMIHFQVISAYNLLVWERVGFVSGAEGFVAISGIVLGLVHHRTIVFFGLQTCIKRLWRRAFQLYLTNVVVTLSVVLIRAAGILDTTALTTYVDEGSNHVYSLFPPVGTGLGAYVQGALLLRYTPHQIQILGLYVFLLGVAPFALALFHRGLTWVCLGVSWGLYVLNIVRPLNMTGAQFENAFPLLTWQVLFVNGLAIGYHYDAIRSTVKGKLRIALVTISGITAALCAFLAQNTTNPFLPAWSKLHLVPAPVFDTLYQHCFLKNQLEFPRIVNFTALVILAYALLTRFWLPLNEVFGWFFIRIGRATLYLFAVHVYLILAVSQFIPLRFTPIHWWRNTLFHTGLLAASWLLVRYKVLFRWIPS
jgi:hypothetical protein